MVKTRAWCRGIPFSIICYAASTGARRHSDFPTATQLFSSSAYIPLGIKDILYDRMTDISQALV